MALRPIPVDGESPFLGDNCALCKEPFAEGELLIVCPDDATRHHVDCWRANGNRCTAYGCNGRGEVGNAARGAIREALVGRVITRGTQEAAGAAHEAKVQTLPTRGFHCAQSCLLLAIAIAIVLIAIGCFGLWALADYIAIEVMGWDYRAPVAGLAPFLAGATTILGILLPAPLL